MECWRCAGLMVGTVLRDTLDPEGSLWCSAWRCIICGEVIDQQILRNRALGRWSEPTSGRERGLIELHACEGGMDL